MSNSSERRKFFTEDEFRRFIRVVKSVRDTAIFTLAYWRGLRASEIGTIPWSAWNQKEHRIYIVRLKKSLEGDYPLSPAEHKALSAWKKIRGDGTGPMFPSRESSSYTLAPHGKKSAGIGRGMIHVLFRDYAAKADLPAHLRHEHVLKHSLATHLLAKGADVIVVKEWLGHRDIRSTMVYAQIRNAQRDAAMQAVYEQG